MVGVSVMFGNYSAHGGFNNGRRLRENMQRKHGKTRAKTVFTTSMVAHVWAQQNQPYGSNSKGSFYFDGATIYSYGSHYPIATLVTLADGKRVALFTTEESTPTTNHHVRIAQGAVRQTPTFHVDNVLASSAADHALNFAGMYHGFVAALDGVRNKRRSAERRLYSLRHAAELRDSTNHYRALFAIDAPELSIPADVASLSAQIDLDGQIKELRSLSRAMQTKGVWRGRRRRYGRVERPCLRGAATVYRDALYALGKARRTMRVDPTLTGTLPAMPAPRRLLALWRAAKRGLERQRANPTSSWERLGHSLSTSIESYEYAPNRVSIFAPRKYAKHDFLVRGFARFDAFACNLASVEDVRAYREQRAAEQARYEREAEERRALAHKTRDEQIMIFRATGKWGPALRSAPCMLRLDEQRIVTSWGAEFPTRHAVLIWTALAGIKARGIAWHANGQQLRLGHFRIDRIAPDGTITAGCHTVAFAEAEAIARQLNLISFETIAAQVAAGNDGVM